MISRSEAMARFRRWAAVTLPGPLPLLNLYEFDLGFVISHSEPLKRAADGTPLPPAETGHLVVVVDRETGEVSQWPSLPGAVVAEKYARYRAAEGRFPPDVREILDQAGWFPGRDMTAAVDLWLRRFADELAGLECFPAARAALVEFGGLILPQFGGHGEPGGGFASGIQPTRTGGVLAEGSEIFAEEYDNPVFPLGNNADGPSELVIDAQGRVFQLHWADDFFIGPDIDSALITLIRGDDVPEASDLTWRTDD
ncbi:SUKH-3 domain-containing protein [Salinispora oceanensis]|uniref:SUKH-3 domain-containing protein n=1 Tax=Salinispora oceanensis TaxID=1050199 RepID=UPI00039D1B10|nr:SUKH-3 domain-containing protein [Salinispora oceanensis]